MHRFFISSEDICEDSFKISGPDLHHIRDVLRLGEGSSLILLDGEGIEYEGIITAIGRDEVVGRITATRPSDSEPSVNLILAQGLPKGDKFDLIVRMCTEIGVSEIIPMITQRSIPKISASQKEKKLNRWRRIAEEAAKQCRRGKIPQVRDFLNFADVIMEASSQASSGTLALMAWESVEDTQGLRELLRSKGANSKRIYLIIGPEGGFAPEEVALAKSLRVSMLSLGRRILRTETAGAVATSLVLYELGDIGGKE